MGGGFAANYLHRSLGCRSKRRVVLKMPTKSIIVCSICGKSSCDGSIWIMVRIIEDRNPGVEIDLDSIPPQVRIGCALSHGAQHNHLLKGKKVEDLVELHFLNWLHPSWATVKKIED